MAKPVKKKKSEKRQRKHLVFVRMSDTEKTKFEQRCTDASLTGADYIRQKCLDERPLRSFKPRSHDEQQLARILALLGNATGNINQIAHALNIAQKGESYGTQSAQYTLNRQESKYEEIRKQLSELRHLVRQTLLRNDPTSEHYT
ncbi:MAG: hypothetical protein KDC45_05430 [Bacteroidetes bacterium]|nr:hypothetical protein [Bacteroidota bacterium]